MLSSFRQAIRGPATDEKSEKVSIETMNSPVSPSHNFSHEMEEKSEQEPRQYISNRTDDYRCPLAYSDGGVTCGDKKQVDKLRSVGKEMIKLIGRKILSGELNLTKISFPIRACAPKTALQNSIDCCVVFPHFVNRAAACSDPLERFKLTATAIICSTYYINMFLKPLNPIIGETLQAQMKDGTKVYCEQISHHPPISYFLIYGPNDSYQFSGYYDFEISPGLNSLSLKNIGKRKFVFKDGTTITASYPTGVFSSTFIGTSRIEETKSCLIEDERNKLSLNINFGKEKKRPSDFFSSEILREGIPIEKFYGTYLGYINIGSHRYWDARDFEGYDLLMLENKLPSDWTLRTDLQMLREGQLDEGQKEKERLEHIQRTDDKLRKKWKKIVKKGEEND